MAVDTPPPNPSTPPAPPRFDVDAKPTDATGPMFVQGILPNPPVGNAQAPHQAFINAPTLADFDAAAKVQDAAAARAPFVPPSSWSGPSNMQGTAAPTQRETLNDIKSGLDHAADELDSNAQWTVGAKSPGPEQGETSFAIRARISQKLKDAMEEQTYNMRATEREGTDLIAQALSCILTGNGTKMTWVFLAGHAQDVADSL
jgi:hypothetical protein